MLTVLLVMSTFFLYCVILWWFDCWGELRRILLYICLSLKKGISLDILINKSSSNIVPSSFNFLASFANAILFSDCFKESSENQSLRPESSHWLSPCTRGPPSNWQDQAFHNTDIYLGSATQSTFKSIIY